MNVFELIALSTALGTDLISVAIPIGMKPARMRTVLKAGAVFAFFHIAMILAGYHAGHWLGTIVENLGAYHIKNASMSIQNWASAVGALVLVGLGIHMLREQTNHANNGSAVHNPLKGLSLIAIAFSVSIDALAAGFSLGMMDVDLISLSFILGIVIFTIAIIGLKIGRKLGRFIGAKSVVVGGGVLILLGLHVMWHALC